VGSEEALHRTRCLRAIPLLDALLVNALRGVAAVEQPLQDHGCRPVGRDLTPQAGWVCQAEHLGVVKDGLGELGSFVERVEGGA
jgi:hypothetical protein